MIAMPRTAHAVLQAAETNADCGIDECVCRAVLLPLACIDDGLVRRGPQQRYEYGEHQSACGEEATVDGEHVDQTTHHDERSERIESGFDGKYDTH
jgi:hypothetical protein